MYSIINPTNLYSKRSLLPEEKEYKIYLCSTDQTHTLYDKRTYNLYFNDNKFSCIQEINYYFNNVDLCNLSDYIFCKKYYGYDIGECFIITDDLEVKWLGFCDLYVIDILQNYNGMKNRELYHPYFFKFKNKIHLKFRDRFKKQKTYVD